MASVNKSKADKIRTHEGAVASRLTPKQQLERSVMSCLLWEDLFYEEGVSVVERIKNLCATVKVDDVAEITCRAKHDMRLRHVPLLLIYELSKRKEGREVAGQLLTECITRPDDMTEFVAIGLQDKHGFLACRQLKQGLARVFAKFNEHTLAKYNGGSKAVKLRDVLRLCHPKPANEEQSALWKRLKEGTLATPDTWEVAVSASKDKKETWTRLIQEEKLGGLAMLRNIRNVTQAGVDRETIRAGIAGIHAGKLLPVNFIMAAKHNPGYESEIEAKFSECFSNRPKLPGKTILVVDTSGSMHGNLSRKSELSRMDVAASLAMIAREMCEQPVIYCTAGNDWSRVHATMQIPARRGFALRDYITGSEVSGKIGGGGIFLVQCLEYIKREQKTADRIIVLTDEQDCDNKLSPDKADAFGRYNYLMNISVEQNGVAYQKFTHIHGWSERVLDFILALEGDNALQQAA